MNKFITALLCLLFFFNGALAQLIKLPALFAHFQEHKEIKPDLRLTDFVAMHYVIGDNNDSDNDRDNQLPFKKFDDSASFDVEVMIAKLRAILVVNRVEITRKSTFSYLSGISGYFGKENYRPPAAC